MGYRPASRAFFPRSHILVSPGYLEYFDPPVLRFAKSALPVTDLSPPSLMVPNNSLLPQYHRDPSLRVESYNLFRLFTTTDARRGRTSSRSPPILTLFPSLGLKVGLVRAVLIFLGMNSCVPRPNPLPPVSSCSANLCARHHQRKPFPLICSLDLGF